MRLLTSANMSLAIEPSGPGLPARRFWPARMLVRRRASASIHSCMSRSLVGRVVVLGLFLPDAHRLGDGARARGSVGHRPPPMVVRSFMSVVIGDPPALADVADAVGVGHPHLGQVDLVELGLAGHLAQRPHLDAGRVHVEREVGQALVLGRLGIGAGDEHAPIGDVGERVPHLLPGDDPLVAVAARPGRPARRGRSRRRAR